MILGPTAVGKTKIAAHLAIDINGEVISADSRQVYRGLDIGTGKDLEEYTIRSQTIPYHLIDVCDIEEEYNVFQFQKDLYRINREIIDKKKTTIVCGGTGLYIEAVLAKNQLIEVPIDAIFRESSALKSDKELGDELIELNSGLHNTTDLLERNRMIRALEIERYKIQNPQLLKVSPIERYKIFGIQIERTKLRDQIKARLDKRLSSGMIEEVEHLIKSGIHIDRLKWFGLEYRYISSYLNSEMDYSLMYEKLLQAIRRFAKKQMTWYRRMEKQGYPIKWIDSTLSLEEKIKHIKNELGDE